ncbi:hypothetical protein D3C76_407060 [compost metagenome]
MNQVARTIELPLSPSYVESWGIPQAIRELLQNAIDSEAPFEFAFKGDTFYVTSRDVILPINTLILGNSTKAQDDSKIGKFGEGYKLALLVLAREGLPVTIRNGRSDWTPQFRHSQNYGGEVLCIDIAEVERDGRDLEFVIGNLSHADTTAIYESCLLMQPDVEAVAETKLGRILADHAGRLYVGGLFVCETDLDYGYDFKPEFLTLERDRQTVDHWDLKSQVKEMWFETKRFDEIAEMMSKNVPDLEYAEYGCPELVKEACYRHFVANHEGKVITNSHEETQRAVAKGMTVVQSRGGYYFGVSQSASYKNSSSAVWAKIKSPAEWLAEWAEQNQRIMSHPLRIAFKAVIAKAAKWKEVR